jgi:4-amino-4-deoxy-L-arabinose transferase-like glycosyltransferase
MRLYFRPLLYSILAYALYIYGLGRVGLVGPDEPRYADVAREMLRLGDYITPRLFEAPWFEKPPLYYWLASLSFRFGINELTARLPSAIAAMAFLAFWFWFSRRFYGDCAAKFGCLILATTVGWIGFARGAAMDMLLATSLSAALALFALWLWASRPAGLYGFYALLGLATLAKGPLALALAAMVLMGYVIHRREWSVIPRTLLSPAAFLFAAVALPWYLLCYWQNGFLFIQEFFIRHNVQRLISGEAIGHPQPFWFYVPIVVAALFPWSPVLLLPLWDAAKRGWKSLIAAPERVLLLYWVILPFVFFSLSENKLPGYLLPILPPLTLWIGHVISEHYGTKTFADTLVRWTLSASVLLLLTTPLVALLLPEALSTGLRRALTAAQSSGLWDEMSRGPVPLFAWGVLAGLAGFSLVLLWRGRVLAGTFAGVLGVVWVVLLLTTYLAPSINRVATMRTIAQRVEDYAIGPDQLAVFYLHRNQVFGLGFYLEHLPQEWNPETPDPFIRYVAAREDIAVDEIEPSARPLSLFPGQRMRLWTLAPGSPAQLAPAGLREK